MPACLQYTSTLGLVWQEEDKFLGGYDSLAFYGHGGAGLVLENQLKLAPTT